MWDPPRVTAAQRRPSPIFLGITAIFIGTGWAVWTGIGDPGFMVFLFVLSGWVVSLCLHEYAHAATAYHSGDHSVAAAGYLTLNPLRYSHALLSIVLPLLFVLLGGIGLPGGAVYINPHALRNRVRQSLVAAAGPATNVAITLLLVFVIPDLNEITIERAAFWSALAYLCLLQFTASVINLLPIPGLDGYGIAEPWLPPDWVRNARKIAPFGILILFALLWQPEIGRPFFRAVYWTLELIGVPLELVYLGGDLFRFWS